MEVKTKNKFFAY